MSSFSGLIQEIPGISVDRFDGPNQSSSAFFLSHCHSDHLHGLCADFFKMLIRQEKYLYCSAATKIILQSYASRNKFGPMDSSIDLEAVVRAIDVDSPICVRYKSEIVGEEYLDVTCMSANHCVGSVMFLFLKNDLSVLYTGDFRLSPGTYQRLRFLHYQSSGESPIKLTSIYLDTTFLDRDYAYFPDREETVKKVRDVAQDWLEKDASNIVLLDSPSAYGYEYLYMELSQLMRRRICIKESTYENYLHIPGFHEFVTTNEESARIRAYKSSSQRAPNHLIIRVSAMLWRKKDSSVIGEWDRAQAKFNVCYSTHCSFNELKAFVQYFKADRLVACVYPRDRTREETDSLLDEISRGEILSSSEPRKYKFDLSEGDLERLRSRSLSSTSSEDDVWS